MASTNSTSTDAQVAELPLDGDDALGRPTVARALMKAGFAESVEDAFRRLLSHGKPGYVPRTGLGPVEAIHAIRAAGGLASIAHFWEAPNRISLLRDLIGEGLNGLESHHRSFDEETRARVGRRPGRWASSRPAGPTTTATSARTPRPMPAS